MTILYTKHSSGLVFGFLVLVFSFSLLFLFSPCIFCLFSDLTDL